MGTVWGQTCLANDFALLYTLLQFSQQNSAELNSVSEEALLGIGNSEATVGVWSQTEEGLSTLSVIEELVAFRREG